MVGFCFYHAPTLQSYPATLPLLYSFRRCPYAIRARMALHGAGVPVVIEEVALRQKPPGLLAVSAKATVPVLVLPDGQVIDQSLAIMRWALRQNDPHGWLIGGACTHPPPESSLTTAATAITAITAYWLALCDDTFKPLLDRYKYANRPVGPAQSAPNEHRRLALQALLVPMEAQLTQTPWLCGPQSSLADVALFPFVRQFAGVDAAWFAAQALPAVQAWLAAWLASRWFMEVMHKPVTTNSISKSLL